MLKAQRRFVLGNWWLRANVYNPLGGKGRVKGTGRQALKAFAVAASDLRLCFQSSSQVNPLDSVCTGAAQRKYLSLKDTSLTHIGFWFHPRKLRNTGLGSMYSICYQTQGHVQGFWVWILMHAVFYKVKVSSFRPWTQAYKPGDCETWAYLVSRGEGSIQFMQKCSFPS